MLKRYGPQIAMALGMVVLLATLAYPLYEQWLPKGEPVPLPQALAGFALDSAAYGPEAVAGVTRLHGKSFALVSGAEGTYGGGRATVWAAQAADAAAAAGLLSDMRARIAQGNSPFQPLADRQAAGRTVYALDGMGQKHFYFQSGALVVWLAADAGSADQALAAALAFYP